MKTEYYVYYMEACSGAYKTQKEADEHAEYLAGLIRQKQMSPALDRYAPSFPITVRRVQTEVVKTITA